jgi:hypothetical protein
MREFQVKLRRKHLVYSYPSLLLLGLVTILIIKGTVGIMLKERASAQRVDELQAESLRLQEARDKLNEKISKLQTEEGIKDEIKRKFSVTEEGEQVAIIVDNRVKASSTTSFQEGWIKNLWQVFLNLWR